MMTQDQVHHTIDQMADSAHDLVDRILSGARSAEDGSTTVLEGVPEHPEQLLETVASIVQEHPLAAAAVALAAGYIASRML